MPYNITPEAPYDNLIDPHNLRVLIPDSGSRGHALAWAIEQDPRVGHVFVAPGNAGTYLEGQANGRISNVDIPATAVKRLAGWAAANNIDLVYSGMEDPLNLGVTDAMAARGIPTFGPTRAAAQVEASKEQAKLWMARAGVPTAAYQMFTDRVAGRQYIETLTEGDFPLVVKDDGLQQGKGVTICTTPEEAHKAIAGIPGKYLIESFLTGQEISLHAVAGLDANGNPVHQMLPAAQDHKRTYDGDKGEMTGGMGVVTPLPWLSQSQVDKAGQLIVGPLLWEMAKDGSPFAGMMFPGAMLTPQGPKVIEVNSRFGGPEGESYVLLLETNPLTFALAALTRQLDRLDIKRRPGYAANVVVAAPGYPGSYNKGMRIRGIAAANEIPSVKAFHSGTTLNASGEVVAAGGRLVTVAAYADTYDEALRLANEGADQIKVEGSSHRRTDIGRRPAPQIVGLGD